MRQYGDLDTSQKRLFSGKHAQGQNPKHVFTQTFTELKLYRDMEVSKKHTHVKIYNQQFSVMTERSKVELNLLSKLLHVH